MAASLKKGTQATTRIDGSSDMAAITILLIIFDREALVKVSANNCVTNGQRSILQE